MLVHETLNPVTRPVMRGVTRGHTDGTHGDVSLVMHFDFAGKKSPIRKDNLGPVLALTRGSNATHNDAAGIVQTVGNNVFRFDHLLASPNIALGLLPEEERTNRCLTSGDIRSAAANWYIAGSPTETEDHAVAPDGTTNATRIVGDTGHGVGQNRSISGDTSGRAFAFAYFGRATSDDASVRCRLIEFGGVAGASTMATTIKTVTSAGWERVEVTGTVTETDRTLIQMLVLSNGSAQDFLVWGGDFNDDTAFITSHVPTTLAAVTRAADVISGDISAIVTPAMTLYFEGRTGFGAGVCMQLDDGTENERFRLERNSSNEIHFIVTDGGSGLADLNLGTVADQTDFKACVSVALNDVKGIITGGTEQTDTSVTMPTVTTYRPGMDTSGDEWGGTIADNKLWRVNKSSEFIAEQVA